MKSDFQVQTDVLAEIRWDPILDAAEIGVSVKNGVVKLSGEIDSYAKKMAAENAAKRVAGVKAVAEDIQVGASPSYKKTDTEIASAILSTLKWNTAVRDEKLKIKVEDGNVRLEGEVEWDYQRANAKTAIANLAGVRSITNMVSVKPAVTASEIEHKISSAFLRNASLDANQVAVSITGGKVTISGTVRSLMEKEAAAIAAWSAPGVTEVENRVEIHLPENIFKEK